MALPGYTIDTYAQLTQIDVTNYKDKTNFFVVDKQSWYYLDKTDNNTWKPCIIDRLNSLTNLTEEYLQREPGANDIFGFVTYTDSPLDNNLPVFKVQQKIVASQLGSEITDRLNQTDGYITSLFEAGTNLGNLINGVTNRVTNLEATTGGDLIIQKIDNIQQTPTVFPKLEILSYSDPQRTIFVVSGFGGPIPIGGSLVLSYSNPIDEMFDCDFFGQQWLDLTNNELWIATGQNSSYYGWRKVVLEPKILNHNSGGGGT